MLKASPPLPAPFPTLTSAATINHDEVVGFPQQAATTTSQKAALKFAPQLKIINGCAAFPAVQANGDVSGGLQPTGSSNGDCESSTGQVYARSSSYNGAWAIMYSWYWPKDDNGALGHRHDWENVVVWIDDPAAASPKILAVSASAHGDYRKYSPVPSDSLVGTDTVKIEYEAPVLNTHALDVSTQTGSKLPLINWEQLPKAAQDGLTNTDWGSANVPFIESNFNNNLAEAYYQ
ncbi:NPP1-domain-containing protein [Violaceomyces palustris]|uniref:NPP1-domain-containing protein n=1 Tax=Violaceomyces palustris TaxID=1673888 RepID=A0ACD0P1M1_9BASI|nr:NPP1-domain-containing protein [Violaceomyces palustris]